MTARDNNRIRREEYAKEEIITIIKRNLKKREGA